MNMLKKIIRFLNAFVFIAATAAVGGVFYEGMELKWFDFVKILREKKLPNKYH